MSRRNVGVDATVTTSEQMTRNAGYALATQVTEETFSKAIVVEIISSPNDIIDLFDDEEEEDGGKNPFKGKIVNELKAKRAPRGSLLVKELQDKNTDKMLCVYPMLQSHVMLPIAVGEQVWLYQSGEDYYWLGRVPGSNVTEDVNFTHLDRDFETPDKLESNAKDKSEKSKGLLKRIIARFNNGAGGETTGNTNAPDGFDVKSVKENAMMTKSKTEAIPRFTPRPGDLALQGSNNTLITLTTDRGWSKSDEDFSVSNAHNEVLEGTGSIDIVAGRGQEADSSTEMIPSDEEKEGTEPTRTGFRRIVDEDGGIENNKLSKQNRETINFAEGDPDFFTDSSRVYVSMHSKIDKRLSLSESIPVLALEKNPEDKEAAAVAIKSNEIRVVARHDGSIRIVKEKEQEEVGSSIIMLPDGSIHITGEKIFLGKTVTEAKREQDEVKGPYEPGMMQPYIRFSVMKEYLEELHGAFDSFCDTLSTHLCPMNSPSPQINAAQAKLKGDLTKAKQKIDLLQSTRIFGE